VSRPQLGNLFDSYDDEPRGVAELERAGEPVDGYDVDGEVDFTVERHVRVENLAITSAVMRHKRGGNW